MYGQGEVALRSSLHQYFKLNPDVFSIYVATNSGAFIQGEDVSTAENYNPLDRVWYKEAVKLQGKPFITEPYKDVRTEEMIVTIAKQLKDRSGVVALDLKLADLQITSESISIGKKWIFFYFLMKTKKVISHPTLEGGGEVKESFFNQIYEKESGTYDYVYEGDKRIVFFYNK
ncbi:PDC sensor domain-containing protein [Lysinibacillus sp. MHQ-1]|nr:PDC sensor domain-containing protein [Lysinibacillus sp. MHQ-1]